MLRYLLNILNNLKIGTRSALSFFAIIFFALLTSISAILLLQYSKNIDNRLSKSFNPAINAVKDIHLVIDETNRICYDLVYQPTKDKRLRLEKILTKQYRARKIFFIELCQEPGLDLVRKRFLKVDNLYQEVMGKQHQLLDLLNSTEAYGDLAKMEEAKLLQKEINDQVKKIDQNIDEVELMAIDASRTLNLQKFASYRTLSILLLVMMVVLVLVSIISLIITNETIIHPVKELSEVLNVIGKGEIIDFEVRNKRLDEIGDIILSTQNLTRGFKAKADVANSIGKGNYEIAVPLQSKNDKLGKALIEMRNNLQRSKETEERNIRELELYTQNLEKRNRELDQFAYITSHDLKSPLRGINNLAEWIEEDMEDKMTPESRKHFMMLRGRVHRMESLINSLLKYSRAGRAANEKEMVSTRQVVLDTLKRLAPHPRYAIYHDEMLPEIFANQKDIEDLFTELIGNAIRYNHGAEPVINITYKTEYPNFVFCVADNGPGIAQEYHNKIFTIFQTLEARDKVESVGAGLAIVKKIVEENGGKVWLDSNEGNGARFYFTWEIPSQVKQQA